MQQINKQAYYFTNPSVWQTNTWDFWCLKIDYMYLNSYLICKSFVYPMDTTMEQLLYVQPKCPT